MFVYLNFDNVEKIVSHYKSEIYLRNAYDISHKKDFDWNLIGLEFEELLWSDKGTDIFKFSILNKEKFTWAIIKHNIDLSKEFN